ncbi:MAG: Fic family protein [Candidatus Kuenenbacteria bacterium]
MFKNRLNKRLNNIPAEIWLKINKIDELKGQWIAGAKLSPQVLGRLKRSVLITSTGASTRIEGAKLSDEDIEKMMRGLSVQKFIDRDVQEVKGYYELLNNIFDSWKHLKFNESCIKHFHKELLKYVEKDKRHCGEYKKQENKIHMVNKVGESVGILFDTTPAFLTPKEMQELVEWFTNAQENNLYHPLLSIGNFLVEFLNIHPFVDGNGRISRILTNLLLLKNGYEYMPYISHEKLIENNKPEYYIALQRSQKTIKKENENITPWLNFFLDILLEQSKRAIELLSKENIEKLLSPKQLAVWEYLNFIKEASPAKISKATKVARPTINQVLDKLLRLKKVERIGQGRTTRYKKI